VVGDDGSDVQAALDHGGHLVPPDRRVTKQSPGGSVKSGPGAEGITMVWVAFPIEADLLDTPI
jgi:hypothetical protein